MYFSALTLARDFKNPNCEYHFKNPNCEDQRISNYQTILDQPCHLFSLEMRHLLRPYGRKNLDFMKRIFNYGLTRARRTVECAFGTMANKWRILHRPQDVNLEFCDSIIKACCILHNSEYVHLRDGVNYEDTLYECSLASINATRERGSHVGATTRDYFAKYITSPHGSVA
jgi:hypothetical protein